MKHRRIAAALSLALVGAIATTFAGCGLFDSLRADSKFPYDVAVERGYDGSEESWLASLDTPSTRERRLYEEAKELDGYQGSFMEFLKEMGLSGADDTAAVNGALRSAVAIEALYRNTVYDTSLSLSMGSGVVYSEASDGGLYVVTNYHVVYSAKRGVSDEIYLYLYGAVHKGDGRVYSRALKASYVGGAMQYDIALLKVSTDTVVTETSGSTHTNGNVLKDCDYLELTGANSDAVTVGERVYAIGNAEGDGLSVTAGIVSVDAEYIDITLSDDSTVASFLEIRTDAAVNHGNSGGGLFNAAGELVGIVNARAEGDGEVGFGYAIPANLALSVAQNILDNAPSAQKGAVRAVLGISVQTADSKAVYNAETGKYYIEEKVTVSEVQSGSLAYGAGLEKNDTVISMTHKRAGETVRTVNVTRMFHLTNYLFEIRQGDTLVLTVTRNGQAQPLDITLTFNSSKNFKLFS